MTDAYAYVIKWQGLRSANTVAQLLKQGVKVRYAEAPFHIGSQAFPAGAVIILKSGNKPDLTTVLNNISREKNIEITSVNSGMVDKGFDFGSSRVLR